jgi:hypothetical protein
VSEQSGIFQNIGFQNISFARQLNIRESKPKQYVGGYIPSRPMIKQSNNIVIRKADNIDIKLDCGNLQVCKIKGAKLVDFTINVDYQTFKHK